MWNKIIDIFARHTLLDKLGALHRFYTASLNGKEKVIEFESCIRLLAGSLKSMGVTIGDSDMSMALINVRLIAFMYLSALYMRSETTRNYLYSSLLSLDANKKSNMMQRGINTLEQSMRTLLYFLIAICMFIVVSNLLSKEHSSCSTRPRRNNKSV